MQFSACLLPDSLLIPARGTSTARLRRKGTKKRANPFAPAKRIPKMGFFFIM